MTQKAGSIVECPHCGKIIDGVGPLMQHMKSCKKKLCQDCGKKESCNENSGEKWFIECPFRKKSFQN